MKPCETVVLSNNQIVGLYPFISSLNGGDATRGNYESLSSDAPNIFRQPDLRKLFWINFFPRRSNSAVVIM